MAKTKKVMSMDVFGKRFSVVFHESASSNPFWLYEHTTEYKGYVDGVYYPPVNHSRIVVKYQNFESCLYHLLQMQMPEFKRDVFPKKSSI